MAEMTPESTRPDTPTAAGDAGGATIDVLAGVISALMPALDGSNRFGDLVGFANEARVDELSERLLHRLRTDGRSIPSSTRVAGHLAIRACFIDPRSRAADADRLVTSSPSATTCETRPDRPRFSR